MPGRGPAAIQPLSAELLTRVVTDGSNVVGPRLFAGDEHAPVGAEGDGPDPHRPGAGITRRHGVAFHIRLVGGRGAHHLIGPGVAVETHGDPGADGSRTIVVPPGHHFGLSPGRRRGLVGPRRTEGRIEPHLWADHRIGQPPPCRKVEDRRRRLPGGDHLRKLGRHGRTEGLGRQEVVAGLDRVGFQPVGRRRDGRVHRPWFGSSSRTSRHAAMARARSPSRCRATPRWKWASTLAGSRLTAVENAARATSVRRVVSRARPRAVSIPDMTGRTSDTGHRAFDGRSPESAIEQIVDLVHQRRDRRSRTAPARDPPRSARPPPSLPRGPGRTATGDSPTPDSDRRHRRCRHIPRSGPKR